MSEAMWEAFAYFGGMGLFFVALFGISTCEDRATAEKMRACAAMCAGRPAEFKDDECRCGGQR